MRFSQAFLIISTVSTVQAFAPQAFGVSRLATTSLEANIRDASDKSETLRFGWDGTTALGGAVVDSQPARMLSDIRANGETIPDACELFNANVEMEADTLMMAEVIELIDEYYFNQLLEFKNGDMTNAADENEGSAKILSYAAISQLDKETTLKLWGQYYRDVLKDPDGDSHQNIRNFMKTGWEGVPFENGVGLTPKNIGEGEWDTFAESWVP
jgi:hypothetical protein